MTDVFRFLPGEKVLQIVGLPGPDTDDCTIVEDDGGDNVLIDFQVYGQGPVHRKRVHRSAITWTWGSETARRYDQWKAGAHMGGE